MADGSTNQLAGIIKPSTIIETKSFLHKAVITGNFKRVRFLLRNGVDINNRNRRGKTCLQIAVEKGNFAMIQFLLDHKAFVDPIYTTALRDGYTPLHFASEKRNSIIVRLLLDYGANIHAMTNFNLMPIHIAVKRGHEEIIRILLDQGADVDAKFDNGNSILYSAVDRGNAAIVSCILQHQPAINNWYNKRAINAGLYGYYHHHRKLVKYLYEYGLTLNSEDYVNNDLIFTAIRKGHQLAVEDLLKHGVDPNLELLPPPSHMRQKGSLLHFAADYEWIDIVKLLLDYGANIHARDAAEKTPLLVAAERNNLPIIKMLLNHGADVNDSDMYDHTALHFTVLQKIRQATKKGTEWISFNNKYKIVKWLLDSGANINAQTKNNGSTCLHIAAYQGLSNVISLLLEYDVDVNMVNHRELTALEYALECMHSHNDRRNFSATNYARYRFINFGIESRINTFRILQQHIHRMYQIGMYVCQKNLSAKNNINYKLSRYFKDTCDEETKQLMETQIGDSSVTFHFFLTRNIEAAALLVGNEEIVCGLRDSHKYKKIFPGYSNLIKNCLKKALVQKELENKVIRLFKFFFREKNLPNMPNECVQKMMSYFTKNEKEAVLGNFM